jgi:hypothetical protein
MTQRWKPADDAKLSSLFQSKRLDPTKIDKESIKKALKDHFPERKYSSFAPLYRAKCSKWNLEQQLAGKRRGPSKYNAEPLSS